MSDRIQIRGANARDAKLLSTLSSVTFFDTFNGTCSEDDMQSFIAECFSESKISKELTDEADLYFIALLNNEPAGYMRVKEGQSDVAAIAEFRGRELKRIYVLKEYHSKKIGAALMKFAVDFAAENHYEVLWLGVWEHNERAKDFYKKFGFIDSGEKHPFPIGKTPQTDNWFYRFIGEK